MHQRPNLQSYDVTVTVSGFQVAVIPRLALYVSTVKLASDERADPVDRKDAQREIIDYVLMAIPKHDGYKPIEWKQLDIKECS